MNQLHAFAGGQSIVDRLPPQQVSAEEAVLGGILIGGREALQRVMDRLHARAFYISHHGIIYSVMVELDRIDQPIDMMSVISRLDVKGKLETIGGLPRLTNLVSKTVSTTNIDRYVEMVVEAHERRQLGNLGLEFQELQYDPRSVQDLKEVAQQRILDLCRQTDRRNRGFGEPDEEFTQLFSTIEKRAMGLVMPGIPSGFYDIDKESLGFAAGDLVYVCGRPTSGKSSFVLNIARNVVGITYPDGTPIGVAYISLEMNREQLRTRQLAMETALMAARTGVKANAIEINMLRSGKIPDQLWEPMAQALKTVTAQPLYLSYCPGATLSEVRTHIRNVKMKYPDIGMVCIDYVQLIRPDRTFDNDNSQLSDISSSLKGMAGEMDVPFVVCSQVTRAPDGRSNKRPMMSDLRGSGSLEQDADLIWGMYNDEAYNPETPKRGIREICFMKDRNGGQDAGSVELLFDKPYTLFRNLAKF